MSFFGKLQSFLGKSDAGVEDLNAAPHYVQTNFGAGLQEAGVSRDETPSGMTTSAQEYVEEGRQNFDYNTPSTPDPEPTPSYGYGSDSGDEQPY